MRQVAMPTSALALAVATILGCDRPTGPPLAAARSTSPLYQVPNDKRLSPELCALDRGDFTLDSANDYLPLGVGSEWLLRGEEDGARLELRITVLDETEVVGGVTTRVVEEREWADGELIEVSRNFLAATSVGTVCYFGEDVDIYENGEVVSHEGAWRADAPGNVPGIIMPADPRPGMRFQMEGAPGIAEDAGMILGIGPVRVPAGPFAETIRVREVNPLGGSVGFKVFARGVGIVIDGPLSLVSYRIVSNG
jgi:hypothetical protein